MRLEKDVFRALCAVVWADGRVDPAESTALLAAARAAKLTATELGEVEAMLAAPTTLDALGALTLGGEQAELVFALACMLASSDGAYDDREHAVIISLGDRLGLSSEARDRAAAASLAIAESLAEAGPPSREGTLQAFARSLVDGT
jgi:tellurite resistance protein